MPSRFLVFFAMALLAPAGPQFAADFEPDERSMPAAALLSPELLSGPNHRVEPLAAVDGFIATYRVSGHEQTFEAQGTPAVRVRVREIEAIATLREVEKSEVFVDAMKSVAKRPVDAIEQTVKDPVGTAKKVPGGVVRVFRRVKRQVGDAYDSVQEAAAERREQRANEGNSGDASVDTEDMKALAGKGYEAGKGYALDQVGYNSSYRQVARRLGVDPYTDNEMLREEMKDVAWVAAAGSLGMGELMPSVPKGFDYLADVNELVWDSHPVDLRIRNEDTLREMGVPESVFMAMLDNPRFTPTDSTRLVQALVVMEGVDGREVIVDLASGAETRAEARFYVAETGFLAAYHAKRAPLSRLAPVRRLAMALTRDGTAIVPLPLDSLAWTREVAAAAPELTSAEASANAPAREIWVRGLVSEQARRELGALGWEVREMREWRKLLGELSS